MLRIHHGFKSKVRAHLATHSRAIQGKNLTHSKTIIRSLRQHPKHSKICPYKHSECLKLVQQQSELKTLVESVQKDHKLLQANIKSIEISHTNLTNLITKLDRGTPVTSNAESDSKDIATIFLGGSILFLVSIIVFIMIFGD